MKEDDINALLEKLPESDREAAQLLLEKVYADVAESDSIYPTPVKIKPIPKNTLEQYYLVVESTCKLCGELTTSFFLMKENNRGGLSSALLQRLPECIGTCFIKMEKKQTLTCSCCRHNLLEWSTEKLVKALIQARGMQ